MNFLELPYGLHNMDFGSQEGNNILCYLYCIYVSYATRLVNSWTVGSHRPCDYLWRLINVVMCHSKPCHLVLIIKLWTLARHHES
jgi:hypothetical protein